MVRVKDEGTVVIDRRLNVLVPNKTGVGARATGAHGKLQRRFMRGVVNVVNYVFDFVSR